jgi:hypothetical protein
MRQVLHIFRKDIRYLRYEIVLLIALSAAFTADATLRLAPEQWSDPVLMLAAVYLIIRVIHAEAIPGDTQFWITRPYRSGSLLAAKLLFLIVVVNLPILAARFLILVLAGFPVIPNLPGLLASQCFLMVTTFLPVAAIAALTSRLSQFVFSGLILFAVFASGLAARFTRDTPARWTGDEWLRAMIGDLLVLTVVAVVLAMQYRNRRTLFSRLFAIGAGIAGFAILARMPISLQLDAQSLLSQERAENTAIQIAIDSRLKRLSEPVRKSARFQIVVPLLLSGVPEGHEVRMDAVEIRIEGTAGATRVFEMKGVDGGRFVDNVYLATVFVDDFFFEDDRDRPVTIRASAYLTLFGGAEEKTYPLQQEPFNVTDSLQGFTYGDFVHFRAAFRMPAQLINARIGNMFMADVARISYSPLPARPDETSLNPLREFSFGPPAVGSVITVVRRDPIAHFRRNVEFSAARFADFAVFPN